MIPWDKIHGATTHFPIALLLFSTACDFVSVTFKKLTFALELRLVSFIHRPVGSWNLTGLAQDRQESLRCAGLDQWHLEKLVNGEP
jgi:uncharacterized membrane protein